MGAGISVIAISAILLLAVVSLLVGLTYRALRLGMRRMRYSSSSVRFTGYAAVFVMAAWLFFTGFLAFVDVLPRRFLPFTSSTAGVVIPLFFVYYLYNSGKLTKVIMKMTKQWFVNIHFIRVFIELMLWFMFLDGLVPRQMTLEGMNFDIVFGLSAPFIAYRCFKSKEWPVRLALVWNILGILSLSMFLGVSLLSTEGPFFLFDDDVPNRLAIQFPFIWLQTFVVPFFMFMHFLSIKQILYRTGESLSEFNFVTPPKRKRRSAPRSQ
jgi:hypothetical protein